MTNEELIQLLDLKENHSERQRDAAIEQSVIRPRETNEQPHDSLTAFEIDAWGLRRGADLLASSERIKVLDLDELAVSDCHVAAFDPEPRLMPACRERTRFEFFKALLETPDYRVLHQTTKLDVNASEIAAVHFAEELDRYRKEVEATSPGNDVDYEIVALRAVNRAVVTASEEVAECHDAVAALGMGPDSPGANDAKSIAGLFRRVRHDPSLRAISSLAGRYRRLAQSRQRRKTTHGIDDVVGVELSGDLGRVLPHELLKLATPPFDLEAMRRFTERQLMSREHHGSEPVAKGPIVVIVDESGSMHGDPVHSAKAIALALAWIARQQRRWCALVAYSGDSGERSLALPPGRWDENKLADWLIDFIGRGSSLDVPIRELPRLISELKAPIGDTDLIAVTDCICQIPADVREPFLKWKQLMKARLITLAIGGEAGDLHDVSDEVHLVRSLEVNEDAVGRVLSI